MSTSATRYTLDEMLCTVLAVGLVIVAILPAARGMSAAGWMPLWLVAMPAAALWALRGFPVPSRTGPVHVERHVPRTRRMLPQARRSARIARRAALRATA